MWKKSKREPAPMKIRMRVTPSGWGFFGLIVCGFLISVNFSNNLIFAMTFLLVAIAMVGWYHTRSNVSRLAPADWRCAPVFAGQAAVYRITVGNPTGPSRHGLLPVAKNAHGDERHVDGGGRTEMTLKRPAPARGRLSPAAADIRSTFPLGIFQARLASGRLPECLVYPAPAGSQAMGDRQSDRRAHLLSEAGEYKDLRRYAPGDPLSRIDWRALARCDELYTKEFDGAQGSASLWLRWEDVRAAGVEEKLSQLCRWVLDAHRQSREYGLEIPGVRIDPAGDAPHLATCLAALALYGTTEAVNEQSS